MANEFRSSIVNDIGTSNTEVFVCANNTQTTVIGLTLANITAGTIKASVLLDGTGRISGSTNVGYIVKDAPIYAGGSLVAVGGDQKVVMEPGDSIKVVSNTSSSVDAVLSRLDIT